MSFSTPAHQRITFEIDGNSQDLVAAVQRAANSLRDLANQVLQEQARAIAGDKAVEASNQQVANSYGEMAASAVRSAAEQRAAVEQMEAANRAAAAAAAADAAAQAKATDSIVRGYAEQAAAAKASAAVQEAAAVKSRLAQAVGAPPVRPGAVTTTVGRATTVIGGPEQLVYGVRGARAPGSVTNPIVVAIEAGRYTGMGTLAAAIGEESSAPSSGANRAAAARSESRAIGLSPAELSAIAGSEATQTAQNATQTELLRTIAGLLAARGIVGGGGGGGPGGPGGPPGAPGAPGENGGFPFSRVLFGTGIAGFAGIGTLASFAGLGFEHVLTTVVSLVGSLASALGGLATIASGAFASMVVGAGADILTLKTTISSAKTLSTDYENLSQAIAVYGKNSQQAQQAQAQLNYDLAQVPARSRAAISALAQNSAALQDFWNTASAGAQNQAAAILEQVLNLAHNYVPLVAQAAQQNLSIIDDGLRPLFAWLNGPQGIGIFQNLEQNFANNLPTAIHAFSQAIEFLLRFVSLASNYTGGFTQKLNDLFTRLNSMDNFQINSVIQRLVNDFRLWETFVRLLITDIYDLFHQDVGTGNSIIATLNTMLQKLHEWETSVQGRASLTNIFLVHKQEVQALLQLLPLLVKAFEPLYMAVAPPLTSAFTEIVKLFTKLVQLIESIPGGSFALGMTFILAKLGVLVPLLQKAAIAMGVLDGTSLAGKKPLSKATVGDLAAAVGSGVGPAATKTESTLASRLGNLLPAGIAAGIGNITSKLSGLGSALLDIGKMMLPGAIVGAGLSFLVNALVHIPNPVQHAADSLGQINSKLSAMGPAALSGFGGWQQGARNFMTQLPIVGGLFSDLSNAVSGGNKTLGEWLRTTRQGQQDLAAWILQVQRAGNIAHDTAGQLTGLANWGTALAKAFQGTKYEPVIQKFLRSVEGDLQKLNGVWNTIMDRWYTSVGAGLPKLVDVFNTNMRLIASSVTLNSAHGRQMLAANLQHMVENITQSMADGKIQAGAGMAAIFQAADQASKYGVHLTVGEWQGMFSTLDGLFHTGAIHWQQYLQLTQNLTRTYLSQTTTNALDLWKTYITGQEQQWQKGKIQTGVYLHDTQNQFQTFTQSIVGKTGAAYQGMFTALGQMYQQHKINTQQLQTQLEQIWRQGNQSISSDIQQATNQQEQMLQQWRTQQLQQDGSNAAARQATWKQYWAAVHQLNTQATSQEHQDLTAWANQIYVAMVASGKVTTSGMQAIAKELNQLLGSLGANKIPAPTSVPISQTNLRGGLAGGGLIQVGRQGEAGPDNIPMTVGGQNIVVGAGEQVAVFNRHQQSVMNQALAPMGGLSGMFQRVTTPHYMASGGYVYPIGAGAIQGRIDEGVDFTGGPFNVGAIGPGRVLRNTLWPGWPGTGGVVYQLTSGPMAGRNVYQMEHQVARVTAGQSLMPGQLVTTSLAGYPWLEIGWANASGTGPLTPYNGAPDGTPMPGGQSFMAFLSGLSHGKIVGVAPTITAPHVQGSGLLTALVQAGLNKSAAAGNAYLARHMPAMVTPGTPGAPGPGSMGSPPPGALQIIGSLARQHGWSSSMVQDWLSVIGAEDGSWSLTATNPTSGAYGIAQFINGPSEYYTYGGNPNSLSGQLTAMANYIAQRYGNPAAAWAHEVAYHSYRRGGLLRALLPLMMAGGGDPGKHPSGPDWLQRQPDNALDFIHGVSPAFAVRDLGKKWLDWLVDNTKWSPIQPSSITSEGLTDVINHVNSIVNTRVPRLQDLAQSMQNAWQARGGPNKHQQQRLEDWDRAIVAYLLEATHDLEQYIGSGRGHGPLDAWIAHLEGNKASGSTVNALKGSRSKMDTLLQNLVGLSGRGGTLGQAEVALEQLLSSSSQGQKQSQLLQLTQQQLLFAQEKLALEKVDFHVLNATLRQLTSAIPSGVFPAFAHGGPVLETGLAYVHRGEYVSPDPQGPYKASYGSLGVPVVNVHNHGPADFWDMVDTRITYGVEAHAPRVAGYELGRQTRATMNAPGRRPNIISRAGR